MQLTREELYELVWSEPRTMLAKKFGVSDVWVAKQCAHAHVPMPAAGHWAQLRNGRAVRRPALPMRLPGQLPTVSVGGANSGRSWSYVVDLDAPAVAPEFKEEIGAQVAAAMAAIGKVQVRRDLSSPHKGLARVLRKEARRRAKTSESGYSWGKPIFGDPVHQRQLRIFNNLAHAFERISVSADVLGHEEQVQGLGTAHDLRLRLNFGGSAIELAFLEPSTVSRARGTKPPTSTTLKTNCWPQNLAADAWSDRDDVRLEQQLPNIVEALLRRAEVAYRLHEREHHALLLELREEGLKEREMERIAAEKRRLAAIAARRKKIRDDILGLAADYRAAQDIRSMVASFRARPGALTNHSRQFDAWCQEALDVADHLDPMKRSSDDIVGDLERGDAAAD